MKIVIFEGTSEELEAAQQHLRLQDAEPGIPAADTADADDDGGPTKDEALSVLYHRAGLTDGQWFIFDYLYGHPEGATAQEIKQDAGWEGNEFRGAIAALPRREKGALGRRVEVLEKVWSEVKQDHVYRLPTGTRRAVNECRTG